MNVQNMFLSGCCKMSKIVLVLVLVLQLISLYDVSSALDVKSDLDVLNPVEERHLLDKNKHEHSGKDEDETSDEHGFFHTLKKRGSNLGFLHAFIASLSVIIVSELGDKTFFIAAILAMRHSRLTVLAGALGALIIMTILSGLVGYATTVVPKKYTLYASSILFGVFGLKMLREAWVMSPEEAQEEFNEVQADLKKKEDEIAQQNAPTQDIETGIIRTPGRHFVSGILSTIFLQSFTLTFLAEWGDRSQIATIALAAREAIVKWIRLLIFYVITAVTMVPYFANNIWGVLLGGFLGHGLCTGLAVVGGRMVAQRISIRTVTMTGGVVFIIFAFSSLLFNFD